MAFATIRFFFDSIEAAALGLETVLLDARQTKDFYEFGGLTAQEILASGILLSGELDVVAAKLRTVPGAAWYNE